MILGSLPQSNMHTVWQPLENKKIYKHVVLLVYNCILYSIQARRDSGSSATYKHMNICETIQGYNMVFIWELVTKPPL